MTVTSSPVLDYLFPDSPFSCRSKAKRKILCLPEGSHFAPQNQEENPLLARGLAFCSAKLGGLICCCNMREYG